MPSISSGALDPDQLEHGGQDVDGVGELLADTAAAGSAAPDGERTMQGSATPPSWTSRFQRLNGVLPAMVQPHG